MKVTCITPTTHDRGAFNERITEIFESQDYEDKEHVFDYSGGSVGIKRNKCILMAKGEIIVHFDSDDLYAPDWISRSVAMLASGNMDMTGLRNAYFYSEDERLWLYRYAGGQPYTIGAAMCYWRSAWERTPFEPVNEGEDLQFCIGKLIRCHDYTDGFTAIIHGKNTASHKALTIKEMSAVPFSTAPDILKKYYPIS